MIRRLRRWIRREERKKKDISRFGVIGEICGGIMHTWDIFDTLIARRIPDGHAIPHLAREAGVDELTLERKLCFPIAENVRQVRPDDLIVSDMHLPQEELAFLVREVTGLGNRVIVSADGKLTGRIWKELSRQHSIALHTGDDRIADDDMARHEGIPTRLFEGARMTEQELRLEREGFHRLAMACREGRLRTFDPEHRELELFQTEINFPMLYLAALALRPHLAGKRVLVSGRDCWLFQDVLRDLIEAEVIYWHSSRLARAFPSTSYLAYTAGLMDADTILFDLCGSGWSLKRLNAALQAAGQRPALQLWMLAYCGQAMSDHYEQLRATQGEVHWLIASPSQGLEHNNLAPHPMIMDAMGCDPVYWNPTEFDWQGSPEIAAQHRGFQAARAALRQYPSEPIEPAANLELLGQFIAELPELGFFPREDQFVQEELRRLGDADSARSLGPISQ